MTTKFNLRRLLLSALLVIACSTAWATDTQPPTAPSSLWASALSRTEIDLAWSASTDNVGVTGYLIERCQGASCSNFAQVGTSGTTAYYDMGLSSGTYYRYRVRATDAASNLSGYSSVLTVLTLNAGSGCD